MPPSERESFHRFFLYNSPSLCIISSKMKRGQFRNLSSLAGLLATSGTAALLFLSGCSYERNFRFADTNNDGTISSEEFDRYMMEAVYGEADTNKDSKITWTEWKTANPGADKRKFSQPDTNRDQVITPAEAKAHFERQGTLDDLFDKIDTGDDDMLDREEVRKFKEKMEAQSGSTPLQKLSQAAE